MRETENQTCREICIDIETGKRLDRQRDRQVLRRTGKQTGFEIDRQALKQTDRHRL